MIEQILKVLIDRNN